VEVKTTGVVNKPLKDCWKFSVDSFADVGKWATGIYHSKKTQEYDRVCDTPFGFLKENILNKNEANHSFQVSAVGLPFFVRSTTGGWNFKELNSNKTEFTIRLEMKLMPVIGWIMGPILKGKLQKALEATAQDYKTFLETGKISQSKQLEIEKLAKRKK